jgi:tRNA(fMet)-specific endonuclease VapC
MNGSFLVDTNIVIAYFNKDILIGECFDNLGALFVPSIVIGELYFGAVKSRNRFQNISMIDKFVSQNIILNCDIDTAREFGEIKYQLQLKGKPIPENDIWIAAIAKQHQLRLVTRDEHFRLIESIEIENW